MKPYETPTMEMIAMDRDVIATSGTMPGSSSGYHMPDLPT